METVKCLPRVYFDTEEVRSSILLSPTILEIKKTGKSPSFFIVGII